MSPVFLAFFSYTFSAQEPMIQHDKDAQPDTSCGGAFSGFRRWTDPPTSDLSWGSVPFEG